MERISQGRLELSCEWPSMPGQTLRPHFLSNREPKAFYQQGGDMMDFMEKDGLKETESKDNELSKEVTARSREKMGKSQPKAKKNTRVGGGTDIDKEEIFLALTFTLRDRFLDWMGGW